MKYPFIRPVLTAVSAALLAGSQAVPVRADGLVPDFATRESILEKETQAENTDTTETGALSVEEADTEALSDAETDANAFSGDGHGAENTSTGPDTPAEESAADHASDSQSENASSGPSAESADENAGQTDPDLQIYSMVRPFYLSGAQMLIPGFEMPPEALLPAPERSMVLLKADLETILASYDGTWSIGVQDLTTDQKLLINNQAMPSASTLKLFILGCVYEKIAEGTLERTSELVTWMTDMIRASSNEAANRLIAVLGGGDYQAGIDTINGYISRQGYSEDTKAYNPFQDPNLKLDPEHTNTTSSADCLLLLERIYRRRFGTRRACNETEEMMFNQGTRYKIPKGVGESALVANKTGETDEIENDIALVCTPAGDYLLCIFSTGWGDKKWAQARFAELSAKVFSYFTRPDTYVTPSPELEQLNAWVNEHTGPVNTLAGSSLK